MKLYIAGSWLEREYVGDLIDKVRKIGHIVTYDWTADVSPTLLDDGELARIAYVETAAIQKSDRLWLVFPTTESRGSFVELGLALAWHHYKPIVSGRELHKCIYNHICQQFTNEETVLEYLTDARNRECEAAAIKVSQQERNGLFPTPTEVLVALGNASGSGT